MVLALRLARHLNTRNSPSYNLVVIPSSKRTTARPLEVVGTYHPRPIVPLPVSVSPNGQLRGKEWGAPQASTGKGNKVGEKRVEWNRQRVEWWLSQGVQPSKTVKKLLERSGVLAAVKPARIGTSAEAQASSASTL